MTFPLYFHSGWSMLSVQVFAIPKCGMFNPSIILWSKISIWKGLYKSLVVSSRVTYYKPRRTPHESDYKKLYRFWKENMQWLAGHFKGAEPEKLKYFYVIAHSGFQSGIAEELGCAHPTISRIFHEVLERIVQESG